MVAGLKKKLQAVERSCKDCHADCKHKGLPLVACASYKGASSSMITPSDLDVIKGTIQFLVSVIKSGEDFSDVADKACVEAYARIERLRRKETNDDKTHTPKM